MRTTEQQHARLALALRVVVGAVVLAGLTALAANHAMSQEKGQKPEVITPPGEKEKAQKAEMAEMMKMWQELATPGEHHRFLDQFVGSWNLSIRMWMGEPGAPPSESKGTSEARWILGGRYLAEETKSEMMMPDPETGKEKPVAFEGFGLTGYDNYKNLYVGVWADNMGTALLTSKGSRDESGKTMTMYGEMDEPMLGVHGRMVKYVGRIIDKDKHVFEMYDLHAGDNYKVMEITYTRKK